MCTGTAASSGGRTAPPGRRAGSCTDSEATATELCPATERLLRLGVVEPACRVKVPPVDCRVAAAPGQSDLDPAARRLVACGISIAAGFWCMRVSAYQRTAPGPGSQVPGGRASVEYGTARYRSPGLWRSRSVLMLQVRTGVLSWWWVPL